MPHRALWEDAGPYALGALTAGERGRFEAHAASCEACRCEVRAFGAIVNALPLALPQIDPPAALRDRILAAAAAGPLYQIKPAAASTRRRPGQRFATPGWLSAAGLVVMVTGLGAYTLSVQHRLQGLETRLRDTTARLDRSEQQLAFAAGDAERAHVQLAVLTAPDMRQVDLSSQPAAPRAAGRGFLSASNGLLVAATELPRLPAGRTYQVWYLTRRVPVSAGLIKPDRSGRVTASFAPPPGSPVPTGLAVSIEPDGGVTSPTGALYLAGAVH
jgi:anti-sigma-K factor RskA